MLVGGSRRRPRRRLAPQEKLGDAEVIFNSEPCPIVDGGSSLFDPAVLRRTLIFATASPLSLSLHCLSLRLFLLFLCLSFVLEPCICHRYMRAYADLRGDVPTHKYTHTRTLFVFPLPFLPRVSCRRRRPDVLPIFTQICSKRESESDPRARDREIRVWNTNVNPATSIWAACDLCARASFLLLLAL